MIIVSNNPKVNENFENVKFIAGSYEDVLIEVKRLVIDNHLRLLTHPLSSSLKPNETYYRTIFLNETHFPEIDLESLEYMEEAIEVYNKFIKSKQRPTWIASVLADFASVDYFIAQSTFERIGYNFQK